VKPKPRSPGADAVAAAVGVSEGSAQSVRKLHAAFLKAPKLQARMRLKLLLQRWQARESKK
jgi:hypothetical protein